MAFYGDQRFDAGSSWAPRAEERVFAVGDAAPDQQAARPNAVGAVFLCLDVGQLEIGPIEEPRAFRALARGEALPCRRCKILRDLLRRAGDLWLVEPGIEGLRRMSAEHVAFTLGF